MLIMSLSMFSITMVPAQIYPPSLNPLIFSIRRLAIFWLAVSLWASSERPSFASWPPLCVFLYISSSWSNRMEYTRIWSCVQFVASWWWWITRWNITAKWAKTREYQKRKTVSCNTICTLLLSPITRIWTQGLCEWMDETLRLYRRVIAVHRPPCHLEAVRIQWKGSINKCPVRMSRCSIPEAATLWDRTTSTAPQTLPIAAQCVESIYPVKSESVVWERMPIVEWMAFVLNNRKWLMPWCTINCRLNRRRYEVDDNGIN